MGAAAGAAALDFPFFALGCITEEVSMAANESRRHTRQADGRHKGGGGYLERVPLRELLFEGQEFLHLCNAGFSRSAPPPNRLEVDTLTAFVMSSLHPNVFIAFTLSPATVIWASSCVRSTCTYQIPHQIFKHHISSINQINNARGENPTISTIVEHECRIDRDWTAVRSAESTRGGGALDCAAVGACKFILNIGGTVPVLVLVLVLVLKVLTTHVQTLSA